MKSYTSQWYSILLFNLVAFTLAVLFTNAPAAQGMPNKVPPVSQFKPPSRSKRVPKPVPPLPNPEPQQPLSARMRTKLIDGVRVFRDLKWSQSANDAVPSAEDAADSAPASSKTLKNSRTALSVTESIVLAVLGPPYLLAGVDYLFPRVYQVLFGTIPSTLTFEYLLVYLPLKVHALGITYQYSTPINLTVLAAAHSIFHYSGKVKSDLCNYFEDVLK